MLLGAMPDESAAGLLIPTVKSRATDFSIAAIMARGAGPPENCNREPSPERNSTGQFDSLKYAKMFRKTKPKLKKFSF